MPSWYRRLKPAEFLQTTKNVKTMTEKRFSVNAAREITAKVRYGNIKTRDGHPVRIVCWNAKGSKPIVGLVDLGDMEMPFKYTKEGKVDTRDNVTTNTDLIIETEGGEA